MIIRELKLVSDCLALGEGGRTGIRCNYGVGILASVFGPELFMMPYETNTLPSVKPLNCLDKIRQIVDEGVPDIRKALGGKTLQAAEKFLEVFDKYPLIKKHIMLYHPDTQGPIDLAELIWGSNIFYAIYDDIELLKNVLEIATQTIIKFLHVWFDMVPQKSVYTAHWNLMFKGSIMLREDSLMNLPPYIYTDLIRPCDQRIFDEFGGGCIHFCGKADHHIEQISELKGITSVNMTQPECNDMEKIFKYTVDKQIKLLALPVDATKMTDRKFNGQVQCELQQLSV